MRVSVVTPPAPVVTWEEADDHLRLDRDAEQKAFVESLVKAATGHLDGPDGLLGRALGLQTLEWRLDELGSEPLFLPCPPFVDVESIRLVGRDGSVTVGSDAYVIDEGYLVAGNNGWPTLPAHWGRPRVRIRYRAGYTTDPDADPIVPAVPAPIKAAILMMVGDLYRFRTTASDLSVTPTAIPMSANVDALLQPYRVYC
ncbi:phage gp6-like head-tail connector protein [Sphingomonadales bacterium 56]|uniref:head-tail connector protein n=1 Tax=Sphingobium sp. S6 TaxID=2758386 RepID=UPI001919E36F|nr:head-tail connector protein [Sphingobium sp. S6]MBY2927478.1 phage gp6-like head-tail connector protein [Sphingomonadales bacterium 56]CAD7335308.1 hypothetical protein SPHS6_00433 [Sphingobium sp. S6]